MCWSTLSAGNLHAPFDVAGDGNQLTVRLVRHSQRKRRATDRSNLRSVAPFLDPTNRCNGLRRGEGAKKGLKGGGCPRNASERKFRSIASQCESG
jgi:hypothetical protein